MTQVTGTRTPDVADELVTSITSQEGDQEWSTVDSTQNALYQNNTSDSHKLIATDPARPRLSNCSNTGGPDPSGTTRLQSCHPPQVCENVSTTTTRQDSQVNAASVLHNAFQTTGTTVCNPLAQTDITVSVLNNDPLTPGGAEEIHPIKRQEDIIKSTWPSTTQEARELYPQFCNTYERIKDMTSPNYCGAQIQVDSGLNCDAWDQALTDYHDKEICHYFRFGWPIGYHKKVPPKSIDDNHPSALQYPEHVREFVKTELGHKALIGPFTALPFAPWTRCSPVMTRPKKDSSLRRVIVDLTFPTGEGVNDGIDTLDYYGKDISYTLPSLGDLVSQLQTHGSGALVWKADLARAYRQLRADPLDTPLLGVKVDGLYYLDLCPPFGCKTSSAACQRMSNAVVYLMRQAGFFTLAYLDDFSGCEKELGLATNSYAYFTSLAKHLGLQLASHKCHPPTTNIEWLGYLIDTINMTVKVPDAKLEEVIEECAKWTGKTRARKKHIQSLAGRLIYITNCITPARRFVARVLATLRAMADREWTTIGPDFHLDLQWFKKYAKMSNGMFFYIPHRKEIEIRCDSSLTGGGGDALNYCYSWEYPKDHTNRFPHIHHLEAVNLLVAYATLAPLVAEPGALLVISTDNISSSFALETGRTKDMVFASCSRELWFRALTNNHLVTIRHKAGSLIPLADALSRQHFDGQKAAYVQQEVRLRNLVVLPPRLDNYHFFTTGL